MGAMQELPLTNAFRAAAGSTTLQPEPALEGALREYLDAARSRWPEFVIDDVEFVRYVAARARDGQLPAGKHAADLLLACACTRSLDGAVGAFERCYGPVIDRVLAHRKASADVAADARQIVLERLLVGDASKGTAPKLGDYRGSGPLHSWVASTAATTLLTLRRSANRRREQPEESGGAALGARLDPELDYLKLKYKAEVEEAIIGALAQLSARDCALLRLHLGERMSIDALGAVYSVNRATAARWLAAARAALVEKTKTTLRARLQLSEHECDSLVGLVQSQLDVSIVRRLSEGRA
jgi:RNA polymerase sigma-70 factor, ECF subfamily